MARPNELATKAFRDQRCRMLAVLSPAKSLDLTPPPRTTEPTLPMLMGDAEALMRTTRRLTQKRLRELMGLSPALAKLNYDRFRSFDLPFTPENALPAIFAFDGDVYKGFEARTLSKSDLQWAQEHVAILSGLFGLLRPSDLMQPYRLEMGTRLETRRGKNLYAFWGDRIAETIRGQLESHAEPVLVNLASQEYFKAVRPRQLGLPVVECVFEDIKPGARSRIISFLAKRARGMMARFIVRERIDRVDGLKSFAVDRYRYDAKSSSPERLVFSRSFVPAGG